MEEFELELEPESEPNKTDGNISRLLISLIAREIKKTPCTDQRFLTDSAFSSVFPIIYGFLFGYIIGLPTA